MMHMLAAKIDRHYKATVYLDGIELLSMRDSDGFQMIRVGLDGHDVDLTGFYHDGKVNLFIDGISVLSESDVRADSCVRSKFNFAMIPLLSVIGDPDDAS